jgi:hypothetical protein
MNLYTIEEKPMVVMLSERVLHLIPLVILAVLWLFFIGIALSHKELH